MDKFQGICRKLISRFYVTTNYRGDVINSSSTATANVESLTRTTAIQPRPLTRKHDEDEQLSIIVYYHYLIRTPSIQISPRISSPL